MTSYYDDVRRTPILRRALTSEENAEVRLRVAELDAALLPYGEGQRDHLAQAISDMLSGFRQLDRRSSAEAVAITHGYLMAMRQRPAWAIVTACAKVRAGEAGMSLDHPPPEPRMNWLAGEIIAPYRARRDALERLLSARAA